MTIPPIPASNPYTAASFGQPQPKTSPATYAATPASPGPAQQPATSNRSDQALGTYSMSQINLAMLLSSQGATIVPTEFQISFEPSAPRTSTVTAGSQGNGVSGGTPTASEEATQIMNSLGSNGMLSLANVESAENGCTTAPAQDLINSNTDADITADFTQLSGGASTMNLAQLTSAIQQYASPQNQHPDSYGKIVMPGATSATSTTNNVPNSASPSSRARAKALEYLWQEQNLTDASKS